jgi:hypothetical protein
MIWYLGAGLKPIPKMCPSVAFACHRYAVCHRMDGVGGHWLQDNIFQRSSEGYVEIGSSASYVHKLTSGGTLFKKKRV